jgi:A/G-specific adenine glycosylase
MFEISDEVIKWQLKHGRHDLPWQISRTPYTVWISEIMLQQTQVGTVRDYFTRFITVFPDVAVLASASEDRVLTLWSGLGYYSRARNLLKAARLIIDIHDGTIPANFEALMNLPGIGRSTAGAILTLAFQKKYPILDGNVKRVLARLFCVDGPANNSATNRTLWILAEKLLPDTEVDTYTQGLMDLGAMVCTRRDPFCIECPLMLSCKARLNKLVDIYPMPKQKRSVKRKSIYMIIFVHKSKALIIKNSGSGLWPGLWGFVDSDSYSRKTLDYFAKNFQLNIQSVSHLDSFRHRLTHIDYSVYPIQVNVSGLGAPIGRADMKWVDLQDRSRLPISVPVRRILNSMC